MPQDLVPLAIPARPVNPSGFQEQINLGAGSVVAVGSEAMNEKRNDYTVPQVAKEFSCSSGTVKNWIKAGRIKAYRLGGETGRDYRIPWAEVDRIRNEWKVSPDTSAAL